MEDIDLNYINNKINNLQIQLDELKEIILNINNSKTLKDIEIQDNNIIGTLNDSSDDDI